MLVGVVLIAVAITYFPALALGPIAEGLTDDRPDAPLTNSAARPRESAAGARSLTDLTSVPAARRKLDPGSNIENPVMFVVYVGSVAMTVPAIAPHVFAW